MLRGSSWTQTTSSQVRVALDERQDLGLRERVQQLDAADRDAGLLARAARGRARS